MHHYEIIARPLANLLKKKQFNWGHKSQLAFQQLKEAMATTPVLALPDFNEIFHLETYACDTGIGAVLMQVGKPIAYLSKPLGPAHQHLTIYEKEFLALIMAVERWRPYLQRKEYIINTYHKSFCYLADKNL